LKSDEKYFKRNNFWYNFGSSIIFLLIVLTIILFMYWITTLLNCRRTKVWGFHLVQQLLPDIVSLYINVVVVDSELSFFSTIDDIQFLIILISRGATLEIGGPLTTVYILYLRIRYRHQCSNVKECQTLFLQQVLAIFLDPRTLSVKIPLTNGQIISFQARVLSINQHYSEYEYESNINFLGKDWDNRDYFSSELFCLNKIINDQIINYHHS